MTVANMPSYKVFTGAGTVGPFAFPFFFFDNTEIHVTMTDLLGNIKILSQDHDYFVIGAGNILGGSVTLTVSLPVDYTLTILRILPIEQDTSFPNQGPFFGPEVENSLDRMTMILQQLQDVLNSGSDLVLSIGQGPQGFRGVLGGQGPIGITGYQGDSGSLGFQGNQGTQGNQGAQGPRGPQGHQGNQGFLGITGSQGADGNQGSQGQQGNQGHQGNIGFQGHQGNQGYQGPQGNPGIGLNFIGAWQTGSNYSLGDAVTYLSNQYVCYLSITNSTTNPLSDTTHFALLGSMGASGAPGARGAQGPQGTRGNQGPQGTAGNQGHQGVQGDLGPKGSQGNQGPQGDDGYQGFQGVQGAQGYTGVIGPTGYMGPQGPPGPQGYQGNQGLTGPVGSTGRQGPQGAQGKTMLITPVAIAGDGSGHYFQITPQGATWTPLNISSAIPVNAKWVIGTIYISSGQYTYLAPCSDGKGSIIAGCLAPQNSAHFYCLIMPILTPQTIWYVTYANTTIYISGYML